MGWLAVVVGREGGRVGLGRAAAAVRGWAAARLAASLWAIQARSRARRSRRRRSYSQNGGTSKTSARATTAADRCAASASAMNEGSGSKVRDQ